MDTWIFFMRDSVNEPRKWLLWDFHQQLRRKITECILQLCKIAIRMQSRHKKSTLSIITQQSIAISILSGVEIDFMSVESTWKWNHWLCNFLRLKIAVFSFLCSRHFHEQLNDSGLRPKRTFLLNVTESGENNWMPMNEGARVQRFTCFLYLWGKELNAP